MYTLSLKSIVWQLGCDHCQAILEATIGQIISGGPLICDSCGTKMIAHCPELAEVVNEIDESLSDIPFNISVIIDQ